MFTYGYIREATMAHLDIDEEEAQAMNLLGRFHIFANEAMQAICGSKPMYKYFEAKLVNEYAPLVRVEMNGEVSIRPATELEIHQKEEQDNSDEELDYNLPIFVNEAEVKAYWNERNIYKTYDKIKMPDEFIAFADKQAWKIVEYQPTVEEILEAEAFDKPLPKKRPSRERVNLDDDFSYISKNQLKFYRPGYYQIAYKCMWYIFESGVDDGTEIDMPSDILMTIPLYIASICLQIDSPQRANIKRNEFELALSRCTSADFMENNEIKSSW